MFWYTLPVQKHLYMEDMGSHYKKEYVIPGVDKPNIVVTKKNGVIDVSAHQDDNRYAFVTKIPNDVDNTSITATHKNGVLTVSVNKVIDGRIYVT